MLSVVQLPDDEPLARATDDVPSDAEFDADREAARANAERTARGRPSERGNTQPDETQAQNMHLDFGRSQCLAASSSRLAGSRCQLDELRFRFR